MYRQTLCYWLMLIAALYNPPAAATPLTDAVMAGDADAVAAAIADGEDVNRYAAEFESTALHMAAEQDVAIVGLLLEAKANPQALDGEDRTPLMIAAQNNNLPVAQRLLAGGAAINQVNSNGVTALHYAAAGSGMEMVDWLLQLGADPTIGSTTFNLLDAFEYADVAPPGSLAVSLIERGLTATTVSSDGNTLLHLVAPVADAPSVQQLLAQGLSPLTANQLGQTPFDLAREAGNSDALRVMFAALGDKGKPVDRFAWLSLLIALGDQQRFTTEVTVADIALRDAANTNLLHQAVRASNAPAAQQLMTLGLSLTTSNDDGETALDLAFLSSDPSLAAMLAAHIAAHGDSSQKSAYASHLLTLDSAAPWQLLRAAMTDTELAAIDVAALGDNLDSTQLPAQVAATAAGDNSMLLLWLAVAYYHQDSALITSITHQLDPQQLSPAQRWRHAMLLLTQTDSSAQPQLSALIAAGMPLATTDDQQQTLLAAALRHQQLADALLLMTAMTDQHIAIAEPSARLAEALALWRDPASLSIDDLPDDDAESDSEGQENPADDGQSRRLRLLQQQQLERNRSLMPLIAGLIDAGADIAALNDDGEPLLFSALTVDDPLWQLLTRDRDLTTIVAADGQSLVAELMVQHPARALALIQQLPAALRPEWAEPLMLAEINGNQPLVSALWQAGAGDSATDTSGHTLLQRRYLQGDATSIKPLVAQRVALYKALGHPPAVLAQVDVDGNSLLHHALMRRDSAFALWLIEQGADPLAVNHAGESALQQILANGAPELLAVLDANQRQWQAADSRQRSLLLQAIDGGFREAVDILLTTADTDYRDHDGFSALDHAINAAHPSLIDLLLGSPPAPYPETSRGWFADPRLSRWSALLFAGQHAELQRQLETELTSDAPHPFTAFAWLELMSKQDRLPTDTDAIAQPLRPMLSQLLTVTLALEANDVDGAMRAMPAAGPHHPSQLFALNALGTALTAVGRTTEGWAYLEAALRLDPSFWQSSWSYFDSAWCNSSAFRQRADALLAEPGLQGTLAARYGHLVLRARTVNAIDRIPLLREWVALTEDPRAATALSYDLFGQGYPAEALSYAQKGVLRYPFYSNRDAVVHQLLVLNQDQQASRYATLVAHWYVDQTESVKARAQRYLAEGYREEGNRGHARQLLEELLATDQGHWRAAKALAELERGDRRFSVAEALLADIANQRPEDWEIATALIDIQHQAGADDRALATSERMLAMAGAGTPPMNFYTQVAELYAAMNMDSAPLITRALADYPLAHPLRQRAIQLALSQGENSQAVAGASALLAERPHNARNIALWLEALDASGDNQATNTQLRQRIASEPWNESLWLAAQPRFASTKSEQQQFWQQAWEADLLSLWAPIQLIDIAVQNEDFAAADALLTRMEQVHQAYLPVISETVLLNRLWLLELRSNRGQLPPAQLQQGLAWTQEYQQLRGHYDNVLRYRETFFRALGNNQSAAETLQQRAELRKDDTSIYHALVARYGDQLSHQQRHGYGYRLLQRNPYDPRIINEYLHKALLWGAATPVVALKVISDARQRGVEIDDSWEQRARDKLGDNLAGFSHYREIAGLGNSVRYLDWFSSARHKALFGRSNQVIYHLDGDTPEVEIVLADGEVLIRRDDARLGKMLFMGRGAAFIRAAYDERGNLTALEESSGRRITLEYNSADDIMRFNDGATRLQFRYNANGKPHYIALDGVGAISVRYQADGEISAVDSDGGSRIALQVTQAFQNLLSLVNTFKQANDPQELPEIAFSDPMKDQLQQAYDDTPQGSDAERQAALSLARYLHQRLADDGAYAERILSLTWAIWQQGQPADSPLHADAVSALELWFDTQRQTRPYGLAAEPFAQAAEMRLWLTSLVLQHGRSQYAASLEKISRQPLQRLKDSNWLERNALLNNGFWHRAGLAEHLGTSGEQRITALLARANGDLLVASSQGLALRRDGYWSWLQFEPRSGRYERRGDQSKPTAREQILALAETDDGVLWLGTEAGLYAINNDDQVQQWLSKEDGVSYPRITALTAQGEQVWVANDRELLTTRWAQPIAQHHLSTTAAITQLQLIGDGDQGPLALLAGDQLQLWRPESQPTILATQVSHLLWWPAASQLWWWNGQQLLAQPFDQGQPTGQPLLRADRSQLPLSKQVHGLMLVSPPEVDTLPAVMTDLGMALWRDASFEPLRLPYEEQRGGLQLGPQQGVSRGADLFLASAEGIYSFEPSRSRRLALGAVQDLLYVAALESTFVATGDNIYLLAADSNAEPVRFSGAKARVLRPAANGGLLTHDGLTVLQFDPGSTTPRELFRAEQSVADKQHRGPLRDLLADADGTVWAVAGSSLFRWYQGSVTEFNYLVDGERFPSRSDMLLGLYRDLAGDLFVVASNESHRDHQGVRLDGGLLKWQDDRFQRVVDDGIQPWFITGYTPISAERAIFATAGSFGIDHQGQRQSLRTLADPSYEAMRQQAPMLFNGGRGARLGKDPTWLFPSAGGVVVYHNGQWFYPDRLNQLLPGDRELGQYGGRTIHALATDDQGRVYVGSDLGLLVYDAGSAAALLSDHHRGELAFIDQANQNQQAMRDIFINRIPADSEQGQLIGRYQQLQQQVSTLEQQLQRVEPSTVATTAAAMPGSSGTADRESMQDQLRERERKRQRLLAELEKDHFALFQMLKLDPREIGALHQQLQSNQILVQYLPTPSKLLIQLVTSEGAQIREVNIGADALFAAASEAAELLRQRALQLNPGAASRGLWAKSSLLTPELLNAQLQQRLSQLYDALLRPIEGELSLRQQVFVTPVGALTYVPFPALLRRAGNQPEYAGERFQFGVLPSMYHFSLVMQQRQSLSDKALFIADPDGSLPGARAEVKTISARFGTDGQVLEGAAASLAQVSQASSDSRLIHFATHGLLDSHNPADSYLVLAGGERLGVIDISMLALRDTDLVILSACESGIGSEGLEYATLARAFAHAQVPSVVASYWQVNDTATKALMSALYDEFRQGDGDLFLALANAQRTLIRKGGQLAEPAAWAAFSVFGRP